MVRYEIRILNALLDSYENSVLSRGENKVKIHISFPFTTKKIPDYFNESSVAYDDIHSCMKELEDKMFISVIWKKGKENHIIHKVLLNESKIDTIYAYLKRIPKADFVTLNLQLLEAYREQYKTPVADSFLSYLRERICVGSPVKEFIELTDTEKTSQLIHALGLIETNTKECYIREFSILHFSDSKIFETLLGKIEKIMNRFEPRFADSDISAILAEYSIYHTPNYVYLKGEGQLCFGGSGRDSVNLGILRQGIGLSGEDLQQMRIAEKASVKRVITVENLTTFFRMREDCSFIIYLGGYHNSVRRELLKMIYEKIPNAEYLHFGDIDVGGFEIYEDLCRKTGIVFRLYHMGIEELKRYRKYTRKLTKNDRTRLELLLQKKKGTKCVYYEVLEYMAAEKVKLEQECVI